MLIQSASNTNNLDCVRKILEILSKISKDKQGCISMNNSKVKNNVRPALKIVMNF